MIVTKFTNTLTRDGGALYPRKGCCIDESTCHCHHRPAGSSQSSRNHDTHVHVRLKLKYIIKAFKNKFNIAMCIIICWKIAGHHR